MGIFCKLLKSLYYRFMLDRRTIGCPQSSHSIKNSSQDKLDISIDNPQIR
jgi:hypothetical protein